MSVDGIYSLFGDEGNRCRQTGYAMTVECSCLKMLGVTLRHTFLKGEHSRTALNYRLKVNV